MLQSIKNYKWGKKDAIFGIWILVVIASIALTSCSEHSCPTYASYGTTHPHHSRR